MAHIQSVHFILCFFEGFEKYPDYDLSRFSLSVSTHMTSGFDLQMAGITEFRKIMAFKEKKTQYLMNTRYLEMAQI